MADLIDRQALLKELRADYKVAQTRRETDRLVAIGIKDAIGTVADAPAVDAQATNGKWVSLEKTMVFVNDKWTLLESLTPADHEAVALALFRSGYGVRQRKQEEGGRTITSLEYREGERWGAKP